jgi:hypothetical protein
MIDTPCGRCSPFYYLRPRKNGVLGEREWLDITAFDALLTSPPLFPLLQPARDFEHNTSTPGVCVRERERERERERAMAGACVCSCLCGWVCCCLCACVRARCGCGRVHVSVHAPDCFDLRLLSEHVPSDVLCTTKDCCCVCACSVPFREEIPPSGAAVPRGAPDIVPHRPCDGHVSEPLEDAAAGASI